MCVRGTAQGEKVGGGDASRRAGSHGWLPRAAARVALLARAGRAQGICAGWCWLSACLTLARAAGLQVWLVQEGRQRGKMGKGWQTGAGRGERMVLIRGGRLGVHAVSMRLGEGDRAQ